MSRTALTRSVLLVVTALSLSLAGCASGDFSGDPSPDYSPAVSFSPVL